jgi:D-alanyl-lipoteichoic acid acyltransferase DltB (MBOAT superfamily)
MLLGGLWHGAAWTFVAWGAYQGALLIAHRVFRSARDSERTAVRSGAITWLFQVIVFFHVVCLGWLLFRAQSLSQAGQMVRALFFNVHAGWPSGLPVLVVVLVPLLLIEGFQYVDGDLLAPLRWRPAPRAVFYVVCFYLLAVFGAYRGREFIYFQF